MQHPKRRKVVSRHDAWLCRNKTAQALVRKGMAEARKQQFSESPPNVTADGEFVKKLH